MEILGIDYGWILTFATVLLWILILAATDSRKRPGVNDTLGLTGWSLIILMITQSIFIMIFGTKKVDVYLFKLTKLRRYYHILLKQLSDDEMGRVNRYVIDSDRKKYIMCRSILKIILSMYTSIK